MSKNSLRALSQEIHPAMTGYNRQDFRTAINPFKVALEQKLGTSIKIALSCDTIGIAVGDEKMPDPGTGQGWRSPC